MKLEWHPIALDDRIQAFQYVARDDVSAAVRMDEAIESQTDQLSAFPHSGRPGRLAGTRELVITNYPYTAVYRISEGVVVILRVLHHAQDLPDGLPA